MPTGSIDLTLRGRDAYTVGPQGQLIPRQPEAGMRRITPASGITASTAPTPSIGDVIARQAGARLEAANRMRAQQAARQQQMPAPAAPAAPAAPSPTIGQRLGTAFRQPLTSPTGMGIMSAALTGLEQAGPQPVPTSTGQILARMGAAGLQAYGSAQAAERERKAAEAEAERQRRADEATAEYRQAQLDLKKREIEADAAAEKAKAQAEAAKALLPDVKGESTLRKEYDDQSEKFVTAKLGFEKLQESSLGEPSAAKDLALIFGYMKVLDPGSVVRENEQASASNAAGVPERVRNIWNRLRTGERLTPTQRLDFISSGRRLFLPYIADQTEREEFYGSLAKEYDFKVDRVVPTKLPDKGSRTNPYIYANEAEAEAAGLTGFAYIGGRFVEITE
jgi:hypothetical protein